jgi:hypothetical protein
MAFPFLFARSAGQIPNPAMPSPSGLQWKKNSATEHLDITEADPDLPL